MSNGSILAALVVVWIGVCSLGAQEMERGTSANWIGREKIRAGWIYHGDGIEQIARFRKHGLNTLVTSAHNLDVFAEWARESRRAGMRLFGVINFSFDAKKAGMRQAVFGNGYESVVACPTDEAFWQEQMIDKAVALAKDGMSPEKETAGILIDFELYANQDKGGEIYYTNACYCNHCFGAFLKSAGVEAAPDSVAFAERVKWLKDSNLFENYHPFLQKKVRALAAKMREAVEAVRKDFFLGFYPKPHNWMLVGTAQGLGSPTRPMILWSTDTYGGGGPDKVPDNWREELRKQDIHSYYCAGMLLRMYSAANLAANMYLASMKGNGYWLFTVHTLCIPEEAQSGDYYLAAGAPQDYLREIRRANDELDKFAADRNHKTALGFVEEPVRYRNVGYDIARFKTPDLADRSEAAPGTPVPLEPLPLMGAQYLLMVLREGQDVDVRFDVARNKSGDVWGVAYAVKPLVPGTSDALLHGKMPPGEVHALRFTARKAGLHTVVLSPGYYGRCTVTESNVPFALSTQRTLEMARPGGKVYFFVPAGLEDFELSAHCKWGLGAARLTVSKPDGTEAISQETDPYLHNAKLRVPTAGKAGHVWSLSVGTVPKSSFTSVLVTFDKRLPQCASLSPRYVFRHDK